MTTSTGTETTNDTTTVNQSYWAKLKAELIKVVDEAESLFESKKTQDVSQDETAILHQAKIDTKAKVVNVLNSTDANTPAPASTTTETGTTPTV
jgi:TRAP-type C4-dicarboxylate transport system substrate-binding protein